MIRSHWRGWNIVLFEDRGSPHRAEASLELALCPLANGFARLEFYRETSG